MLNPPNTAPTNFYRDFSYGKAKKEKERDKVPNSLTQGSSSGIKKITNPGLKSWVD
jgi:hypothetical protein